MFCCCCYKSQNSTKHMPNTHPETYLLFIDERFNQEQEIMMLNAINAWEEASSYKIKIIPYLKVKRPGKIVNLYNKSYNDNSIFVWNIYPNDLNTKMTNNFKTFAGLWDDKGNILIFTKELSRFYNVILHEIGHTLGLEHFNNNYITVMHCEAASSCITEIDAKLLCEIHSCTPNPECKAAFNPR